MRSTLASVVATAGLALAACGSEEMRGPGAGSPGGGGEPATTTPQTQRDDERELSGSFRPLEADPRQDAGGSVRIVLSSEATEGRLNVRGLDPDTAFVGELRTEPCEEGVFRLRPGESEGQDPLAFQFVTGGGGAATDRSSTEGQVPGNARSVVLFPQAGEEGERGPPGVACADLKG